MNKIDWDDPEARSFYMKGYRKKNINKIRANKKEYHKKNYIPHPRIRMPEQERLHKARIRSKRYRESLNGKIAVKKYCDKNREKLNQYYNNYYKENKSRVKKYMSKYIKNKYENDTAFRTAFVLRRRLRGALQLYSKNGKCKTSDEYGINYKKIIESLKPFPADTSRYHIDHIIPLSSFNMNDPAEIRKAFAPENHQWLLAAENLAKGKKITKQLKIF